MGHNITKNIKSARLILGDQLSLNIPSLIECDKENDVVIMCELWEEATYVKHHKKKLALIFSAMRHFAEDLKNQGYQVHYVALDDPLNTGTLHGEVNRALGLYNFSAIIMTFPGEYRLLQNMLNLQEKMSIAVAIEIRPDNRFLCTQDEFENWAGDSKTVRMEFFYREMRKKFKILMFGDQPEGGKWNYDVDNRKPLTKDSVNIPKPLNFKPDAITKDVLQLVQEYFHDHFGDLEPFHFAVTRTEALKVLAKFIDERLPLFGDFQDIMLQDQPWMYHAHISFYLNCGLLEPLEVIKLAEDAFYNKYAPLNAVEGFIRQIVGWREYIHGVYWLRMPDYKSLNYFDAKLKLPWFYWDAETDMNCLRQCVTETRKNAYAHHIQRLMVLGNFALLAGIDPDQVNEWYLIVYADAYEWVELPNVSGMILFADGGYLASKPYAASGAYINKMSNYCQNCRYDVNKKNGPDACPFNYIYWNFMIKNRSKLERNPRLAYTYATLGRMSKDKVDQIVADTNNFLEHLK